MPGADRARIERAVHHICAHLDEALTLRDVAALAHTSEFHFHRLFSAAMGETVGRFITRKRLELAALRLAYEPRRSITDIALSSGYATPSNFTKAFRAHFGMSPSEVRRPEVRRSGELDALTARHGRSFDPADLQALPPDVGAAERARVLAELAQSLRFEHCPGIDVAALASPEGYDLDALMATWHALITSARALGITGDEVDAFGMSHDSPTLTAPELCRYHACIPCPAHVALPSPLFRARIPRGRYAIFRYAGEVRGVEAMYRRIYGVWLTHSGVEPDDFTAVERYVHDFPAAGRVDMEIWIKLRDAARATPASEE